MVSQLIVAIGMPRAGSGWHYNLIHDLVLAAGGADARKVRRQFLLHRILTEVNCNIGSFTAKRLLPVMVPALLNKRYVIKAHAGPTPLLLQLVRLGMVRALYIYRDPRDALLSAYEYGQRKHLAGRGGAFSDLDSIEKAIDFMVGYVAISEDWIACERALHTRFEDLVMNYREEAERLVGFLGLNLQNEGIQRVIQRYQPERGHAEQRGTHYVKGVVGRYREKLTAKEQDRCIQAFSGYLNARGYPIP